MKYIQLTLYLVLFAFVNSTSHYDLIKLPYPDALCLDGSPGAYYLNKGDPDKVILYFQGGGWCGATNLQATLESCYQRSKGALGSSKSYPATMDVGIGFLSDEQGNSFKNWTKVYLKYCDGSGHQGSKSQFIKYKEAKLYFRGQNVTVGQLESLNEKINLWSKVSKIVVSGGSAGGLAAFLWGNYVQEKAKNAKVWTAPDSGIFLDAKNVQSKQYSYRDGFQNLFKLSNTQTNPPTPQCLLKYPNEKFKCMFAENIHEFIKTPLFPIQSLYDSWSLPNILGINCNSGADLSKCTSEQMQNIEEYHQRTSQVLMDIGKKEENGYWAPICVDHVYSQGGKYTSPAYRIPMNSENSQNNCLWNWIEGQNPSNNQHMDRGKWPENKPCSGVKVWQKKKQLMIE